jgi:sugar phosphate isomerase/epimerase
VNKNMRSYIAPGIIHFMAFPETIKGDGPIVESVLKIAEDDYFDFIEMAWIKDNVQRNEVKSILDTAGMGIGYAAQPRTLLTGLNLNHLDNHERAKAVATIKEGIDEAYELGAKGLGFLSGKWSEESKDEAFEALVESTGEICRYAAGKGDLKIHLEIFDSEIDKCSLIGPVSLAKKFAALLCRDYDNFGLLPDLSHLPLLKESAKESLVPIADYISHTHIGNCVMKDPTMPAYGDQHPRFGFPGSENGVEELAEYLRVLIDIGYLVEGAPKPVSFEVKPFEHESSALVIANAKRALNAAWVVL